ncbi:DUF2076 domain-containing protein [Rouxiella sp. WC2420]|uniref:DUF2076 domain-containing protein n=1 Tax=Rouxiella sp. WC2420 TaxID=3234145 RepID=A0AB39VP42_9GAMM
MQSEEQRLIEGLFSRLQQAESNTAPRDAEAERLIQSCVSKQPSAPYYMAQSMIIQEAALKRMNAQVQELQQQVAQLQSQAQNSKPQSTGFLAGLFGGGNSQPQNSQSSGNAPIPGTQNNGWGNNAAPQQPAYQQAPQQPAYQQAPAAPIGSGFIGGALKTAAGVAGGVVLADMLTGMFHHSQPSEIVNIVEDNSVNNTTENFNPATDPLLSGDNSWDNPVYNNDNDNSNSSDNTYSGFLNDSDDSFFGGNNDDDDDSFF